MSQSCGSGAQEFRRRAAAAPARIERETFRLLPTLGSAPSAERIPGRKECDPGSQEKAAWYAESAGMESSASSQFRFLTLALRTPTTAVNDQATTLR